VRTTPHHGAFFKAWTQTCRVRARRSDYSTDRRADIVRPLKPFRPGCDGGKRKEALVFQDRTETSEAAILELQKMWYWLGGLQFVFQAIFSYIEGKPSLNLLDGFFCVAGGYFLGSRKSRAIASVLFLYAVLVGFMTFNSFVTHTGGGRNWILALIIIYAGGRGIRATWLYHSTIRDETRWKWVFGVTAIGVVCAFLSAALLTIIASIAQYDLDNEDVLGTTLVAGFLLGISVMIPLTSRYPFAEDPEPAGLRA
jgi:hypothetical protein